MFKKEVYVERRKKLQAEMNCGLVLLPANTESPMNYLANTYHFRQDSTFLYFFGLNLPNLVGVVDIDSGEELIYGNDINLDDIIWMGPQPKLTDTCANVGIAKTKPLASLDEAVKKAILESRQIHFLAPYRAERKLQLENLLGINHANIANYVSEELINAVVKLRSVKDDCEVIEMENTITNVTCKMYDAALKAITAGKYEREISGLMEGISMQHGGTVAYPVILSVNGETLHNHYHGNKMQNGDLLLIDAGAESTMSYATDITRTFPVSGKFTQKQREIYEIVLRAETECIEAMRPGVLNRDIHLKAAQIIATGLKEIGLMKGNVEEAVKAGAHAMFFPHGLGHMIGLDVHDMEDIGENYVGYNAETIRAEQFGLAYLRMGRRLEKGFVLTVEPGIYFIPALIDKWRADGKFMEYINYEKVDEYKDFGGIRIEDDVLVTEDGYRILGKNIPKTVEEIEAAMAR